MPGVPVTDPTYANPNAGWTAQTNRAKVFGGSPAPWEPGVKEYSYPWLNGESIRWKVGPATPNCLSNMAYGVPGPYNTTEGE
jgi:hypothetical protein